MRPTKQSDTPRETARAIAADCIGFRVRMLNRVMTRIYDEELRPHGIKFSQMNILTAVTLHGPVQPVDVAGILAIEKSTLSRNLRIMEENGWIESTPGEAGNTLQLRTTAAGKRLLKSAAPAWRAGQDAVTALLGDAATTTLKRAIDRMRKKIS